MDNYMSSSPNSAALEVRKWLSVNLLALLSWLGGCFISWLILFPALTMAAVAIPDAPPGLYVLDQAGVMSNDTKSMIISTSEELARQTKAQVAVVTMKTLDGQPIADVAMGIGRKWQLGDKQLNNGLVILVVTSERKSRIEVGYGLEGALPDGKTGRIQDEYMLPAFKQGDYDLGLANGYKAIVAEVAKEYGVSLNIQGGTSTPTQAPVKKKVPVWATILGAIALILLLWLDNRFLGGFLTGFILGMLLRGGGRGGGGGGDSGGGGSFGGGGSDRDW